jgi:hypothetical protein
VKKNLNGFKNKIDPPATTVNTKTRFWCVLPMRLKIENPTNIPPMIRLGRLSLQVDAATNKKKPIANTTANAPCQSSVSETTKAPRKRNATMRQILRGDILRPNEKKLRDR